MVQHGTPRTRQREYWIRVSSSRLRWIAMDENDGAAADGGSDGEKVKVRDFILVEMSFT